MSGSSGSSGSSGERRHRGRNVRGRIRLHQFLPNEPVLADAAAPQPELHLFLDAPAPAQVPAPAAQELQGDPAIVGADPAIVDLLPNQEPELHLFLGAPAPAQAPAPAAQELQGDPAIVGANPFVDIPYPELLPPPPDDVPPQDDVPVVFQDIPGFPEFPELQLNDNQGYRHLFSKNLSGLDITKEITITVPNLHSFCRYVRQDLVNRKCMVRLSVLLGGGVLEGFATLRVGNTYSTAFLKWQAVLGENVVQPGQLVFAWFKRMELNGIHIVIQVQ